MAKVRGSDNPFPTKPKAGTIFPSADGAPDQHKGLLDYAKRPHKSPERPKPSKDKPRGYLHHYGDKRSR